jgi:hypothetical protein
MTKPEWITVAAIILGPILALLAQRGLDWLREKDARRRKLYFTLMSTRAVFASNEHVQALNSIDVVFTNDRNIRELWKKCLDHLATDENAPGWNEALLDLRADLYQAIGNKLGYRYTTDYIKRGLYFPKYHDAVLQNQNKVLQGFAKAVEDGKLRVEVSEPEQPMPVHIPGPRIPRQ